MVNPDYLAYFTQIEEKAVIARAAMKQRVLVDPVASAVIHIVRLARETAAEPEIALLDATVMIMEIIDAQKQPS